MNEDLNAPQPSAGPRFQVRHRTLFEYAEPVSASSNIVRLEPHTYPFQRTLSALIKVLPSTRLQRHVDLFGNITHRFEILRPHNRLEVDSLIRIENLPLSVPEASHAATREAYTDDELDNAHPFLLGSHYIDETPALWRQALDITHGIHSIYDASLTLMRWVHDHFLYLPNSTHVHTRISESFELRSGVCQDFSHIMIGLCRAVGIPCRYASGYLYNGPRDTLIGAQASHAWAEVFLPYVGWVGFDPTNNTLADERYIKVAVGRDYLDVAPVTGSYFGTQHCRLTVTVDVEKLSD